MHQRQALVRVGSPRTYRHAESPKCRVGLDGGKMTDSYVKG